MPNGMISTDIGCAEQQPESTVQPFIIRTSERTQFRKCRRLWAWVSPNKFNLSPFNDADYFWFGTGVHYALEDYHGYNVYGSAAQAFRAYVVATKALGTAPPTATELELLGVGTLRYYAEYWLKNRPAVETYWVDGIPQCEVNFQIDLNYTAPDGRPCFYRGTIDRVAIDGFGRLWVVEYKTAKAFRLYHFDTDDQITAYCWAAQQIYQRPVAGVVYLQFKKTLPQQPRFLASGRISIDKKQHTTAKLYRQALLDLYGEVKRAPQENIRFLNDLTASETEEGDAFIRRDYIERSQRQIQSQEEKIYLELEEMSNPNLALYPNPGRDCGWGCPLNAACVAVDDGSDFEGLLAQTTQPGKERTDTPWRQLLPAPVTLPQLPPGSLVLPEGDLPESHPGRDFLEEFL